jgi:putative Flp pilus-assembly TadE/G-like protein
MRVIPSFVKGRLDPDDDRGAVVVLVVICLVAIFGMIVLTIDVGGMLIKRRHLVNGSDAAAFAAAQSCTSQTDTSDPETQADLFAADNVAGLTAGDGGIVDVVGCDTGGPGHVTVEYAHPQPLFFAGVLGFGDSASVRTRATVAWGWAGSSNSPVPVVLNLSTFQGDCDIPNVAIDTKCYLWYDNDLFDGSNFGFLDLEQWDVPVTENCNASGGSSTLEDWIDGLYDGPPLGLNYVDSPSNLPTYVCTTSGLRSSTFDHLGSKVGQIKFFPINDPVTQIKQGNQVKLYNIIGFAALRIEGLYKKQDAPAECGPAPNSSARCLVTSWQGHQFGDSGEITGTPYGVLNVRLCDMDLGTCPPGS